MTYSLGERQWKRRGNGKTEMGTLLSAKKIRGRGMGKKAENVGRTEK